MSSNSSKSIWAQIKKERVGYYFIAPVVIYFCVFMLYPIFRTIYLSFVRFNLQGDTFVGFQNYKVVLSDPIFWKSLWVTFIYTLGVVPVGLAISLFLSVLIFQLTPRMQTFFKAAFYLPGVVSAVVVSLIWVWMFDPIHGLLNYFLSWFNIGPIPWLGQEHTALLSLMFMAVAGGGGSSIILILAAMGGIPTTLYEAAKLDGAGAWTEFWTITVPLLKPTILYLLVMGTIGSFQVFTNIYMMTSGGPNYSTSTIVYRIYQTAFAFLKLGRASAMALVLAVIIVVISAIQFKFFGQEVEY